MMVDTNTSLAICISTFLSEIRSKINCATVFSIEKDTAQSVTSETRKKDVPANKVIFAWYRSPLRPNEEFNKRSRFNSVDEYGDEYKAVLGTFDINWTLHFPDIKSMEQYEVKHLAKHDSLNCIEDFSIEIEGLGEFRFTVEWNPVESVEINKRDVHSYSIPGLVVINGIFIVSKNTTLAKIEDIYTTIFDNSKNILAEFNSHE